MSSKSTPLVGALVSILIIGAIASIGYYQFVVAPNATTSSTTTSPTTASCTPTTCVNVSIVQGAASPPGPGYSPASITLVIGRNNTVVWTNDDVAIHTVTDLPGFNSANIVAGAVFQHTFTVAGTYKYTCSYHSWMQGTIVVKSA